MLSRSNMELIGAILLLAFFVVSATEDVPLVRRSRHRRARVIKVPDIKRKDNHAHKQEVLERKFEEDSIWDRVLGILASMSMET